MNRAVRWIAASALLSASSPASAFVHGTTKARQPDKGHWLWWGNRDVTYRINASKAAGTPCGNAGAAQAAEGALATWRTATRANESAACTDFGLRRDLVNPSTTLAGVKQDGVNLVVFRTGLCRVVAANDPCRATPYACAEKFGCWDYELGTIGLTTTWSDPDTGEIVDADVELNAWDGASTGYRFTCAGPGARACTSEADAMNGDCNGVDLGAVVTHEAGHMLGLDHVCDSAFPSPFKDDCPSTPAVMAPSVGNVSLRVLSQDDVAGVCAIYPVNGPTLKGSSDPTLTTPKKSGGGCSSAGGTGIAALIGAACAAVASRLGRRRR